MKTVIIIDDEEDARNLLKFYIRQHNELSIIGEATNGTEAVQLINNLKPDTIFLDIQMPGLNGFEVLTHLEEIPEVIFSTAYDKYAIKAFEVHAVDYLLKPYGKTRFESTLTRILKNQETLIPLTEEMLGKEANYPSKIILHKGTRKIMVTVSDIVYGEAYGDYTKIFTETEEFLSLKGISKLIMNLNPEQFIRLHRSHFVSKNNIVELEKSNRYYSVLLSTDIQLRISESYLPQVKKMLF